MHDFFSKLRIFLNSRKVFKNWYIYPNLYYKRNKNVYAIFETRNNLKIKIRVNSTDLMALTNVWMINEYEVEKLNIKNNDVIIDIGAHIGLFSLLVSKFCYSGKIFCFEPNQENFDMLTSNINYNKLKNIIPFNLAVTKNESEVKLFLDDDQSAHSIFPNGSKSIAVDSISLQKIFDEKKISACKLLKLDCEGAEYDIIDSLPAEYLDKIQNMAIEYHFADTKPELIKNLITKIKNAGFKIKTVPHYDDMGFLIARK